MLRCVNADRRAPVEGRKQFFFEKKNQKTFVVMARAAGENRDSDVQVPAALEIAECTMKTSAYVFRAALAVAWLVLLWVTARAIFAMGANAAGVVFFGDMAHPWRAQFNTDFGWHLLLVATWLVYRDRLLIRGLLFGLLAVMLGGIFTLAFVFVETVRTNGDMRRLLLGARA